MSQPLKYVMYLRKSTDAEDRQIQSIEDQERELNLVIKDRKIKVIHSFREARSAKKPGRPLFNEMMAMIRKGEADGIICWKPNRLARNPVDGGVIQWLLQQGIIKSLLTPSREYLPSDNVIMLAVEFDMANQYSLDLAKDVRRGMQAKAEKGWRPHQAPIGYLNDKHGEQGNKKVYVDEERFPLVRKMCDGLLTGNYTIPQITAKATDEWGLRTRRNKKLSLSTVYKLFTNPFYFGEFEYGGAVYQGKHQPMITPEEFDRVQKLLGLSGKPRPKTKRLPFTGIIRCNQCRCSITCEEKLKQIKTTGKTERYIYHRCTKRKRDVPCASKPITFTNLSGQVKGQLASVELHPDILKWAIKVLRDRHELEQRDRNQILNNHQKNYQACVKRIDNLIDMYVSPENADRSMLTEAEYKERKAELLKEKAAIESEIRKVETRVTEWLELTEKTFHFATYAAINFAEADFETKTKMLRALGQNFVLDGGILRLDLKKPYLRIKNGLQEVPIDKAMLELARNPGRQPVTAIERVAAAKLSRWSGRWSSNWLPVRLGRFSQTSRPLKLCYGTNGESSPRSFMSSSKRCKSPSKRIVCKEII